MASTLELEGKMDSLLKAFTDMGKLLQDMKKELSAVGVGVTELKEQSKAQDQRIGKLEVGKSHQELRIINLEDRQRRPNLRLRGFPKDFAESKQLIPEILQWFTENKVKCELQEFERAHWAFGPRKGDSKDIVVRFVSERRAAEIFKELKQILNLRYKAFPIRVLKDLSAETLKMRNQMREVSSQLYENGIKFSWRYPATIIVFKDTKSFQARSLEEGRKLLFQLGLNPEGATQSQASVDRSDEAEKELFLQPFREAEQSKDEKIAALQRELASLQTEKKDEPRITRQKKNI